MKKINTLHSYSQHTANKYTISNTFRFCTLPTHQVNITPHKRNQVHWRRRLGPATTRQGSMHGLSQRRHTGYVGGGVAPSSAQGVCAGSHSCPTPVMPHSHQRSYSGLLSARPWASVRGKPSNRLVPALYYSLRLHPTTSPQP